MKTQWLLLIAILGAAGAALLARPSETSRIAREPSDAVVSESALAALQGAEETETHGPLPPGHPPIDQPDEPGDPSAQYAPAENQLPDDPTHRALSATPSSSGAPEVVADVPVATGKGGMRIAQLFSQRKQLVGTQVRVRGQVVKVAAGILGTNFVHLRDGSGSAQDADHDLTLTMDEVPQVGQILLVRGTVKVDHNLGAGYLYPVLLEKAVQVPE